MTARERVAIMRGFLATLRDWIKAVDRIQSSLEVDVYPAIRTVTQACEEFDKQIDKLKVKAFDEEEVGSDRTDTPVATSDE